MFKFLFVIFSVFILLLFLMGFSVFRVLKSLFFGSGNNERKTQQQRRQSNRTSSNQQYTQQETSQRKKIIEKDEGEYVDYEEVK